ncbi:glucose-1-phosphate adenylyltransferase small subunit, chloroplastic-like [Camellia sinensis]|uniref:glucose-1-phosphate adenylyltransferase small subunit, chloroplastic-like n=1 Tax=Camellia sinensis TaxID=4442 RepID=UPI00103557EB|nr:glucose-1-phosphate adenylyltransferase small subunit, chloroplastic-like [Camellia sinensis]
MVNTGCSRAVSISKLHRHHRHHRPHSTARLACERENLRATPSRRLSFARLISPVTRSRQNRPLHSSVLRLLPATGLHSLSLPRPSMIRRIRRLVSILMQADVVTSYRSRILFPLGANYRLIDIPVRNCLNRNISKIYVLTQFNSASLNRHLSRAYASNMGGYKNEGFVEVLAAQQSPKNPNWFQTPNSPIAAGSFEGRKTSNRIILVCHGSSQSGLEIPNLLCTPHSNIHFSNFDKATNMTYSKSKVRIDVEKVKPYYLSLIEKDVVLGTIIDVRE